MNAQQAYKELQIRNIRDSVKTLENVGAIIILPDEVEADLTSLTRKEEKAEKREKRKFERECKDSYRSMDAFEYAMDGNFDELLDSIVPACCKHGCQVEPDGHCVHGNPSILLDNGLI